VKVEDKEPTTVVMVDGQMVAMVPKVMLLVQVVEDLLVSLKETGRLVNQSSSQDQVVEVDTDMVEPEEEKMVVMDMVVMVNLQELHNLQVDLVVQVYQAQDILVVTVTQEDNKTQQP
jgi:hypothetical protein